MRTLIRNARCVLPDETRTASVLVDESGILDIDPAETAAADETIAAAGLTLLPGVIDDQVHFRDPGLTHKEDLRTGSRACAKGGVTTFFEMPNTKPATISVEALHEKLDLASGKCVVNYAFFIGATPDNVEELADATRTPGIKIFIGSSTGNLLVDRQAALERIFAETTLPITAHCEDEATVRANFERIAAERGDAPWPISDHSRVRDHAAARISTQRAFDLAIRNRHRFHLLHTSTADEVELIRGLSPEDRPLITAEACPHHLLFNVDDYERLGTLVQMNPSIKTAADNAMLWDALRDGTIDIVATDHAPHTIEEKRADYPNSPSGLPAVENSLSLMLTAAHDGRCTLEQVVRWMCSRPAEIWSLPSKGRIAVGCDADLALVDTEARFTVRNADQESKCGWSPWDGETLTGQVVGTWVHGRRVYDRDGFGILDEPAGREATFVR